LRFLVAGSADVQWFLNGGALGAQTVRDVAQRSNLALDKENSILDFGCGCGRVTRHWRGVTNARVCGTDYNQNLIAWCQSNLGFAEFRNNQLTPPLSYQDSEFDLIYAFSVFTHLTEDLQAAWMAELSRILKPGGHLLISTHGERYLHRLNDEERRRFAAGQLVVKNDVQSPGTNACSAYHPHEYVRNQLAHEIKLVEFQSEGAAGNPHQDLYVFQRP
jgi:cyclopropane fatty-acyl-phospholipid synthase-like methyltransferase